MLRASSPHLGPVSPRPTASASRLASSDIHPFPRSPVTEQRTRSPTTTPRRHPGTLGDQTLDEKRARPRIAVHTRPSSWLNPRVGACTFGASARDDPGVQTKSAALLDPRTGSYALQRITLGSWNEKSRGARPAPGPISEGGAIGGVSRKWHRALATATLGSAASKVDISCSPALRNESAVRSRLRDSIVFAPTTCQQEPGPGRRMSRKQVER